LAWSHLVLFDEALEGSIGNVNTTTDIDMLKLVRANQASDLTLTDTNPLG
jgi:hypothetical protein